LPCLGCPGIARLQGGEGQGLAGQGVGQVSQAAGLAGWPAWMNVVVVAAAASRQLG